MTRKLLFVAFLLTIALTLIAANHQLTNAAANMAPPPQHAPAIGPALTPAWHVVSGGGGKDAYLTDVSMSSSTDGWAVGVTTPSSYGVLMHYDGSIWSQTAVPTGTYHINAVKMISPTSGWAVGGTACGGACDWSLLLHYTNGTWQKASPPPYPGGGLWPTGFSDVDIKGNAGWAIGYGWALRFDGASWTPVSIPTNYIAVSVIDGDNAWAVGTSRNALHYTGGSWSSTSLGLGNLPVTLTVRLKSIHMLNAGEGWAAGFAQDYSSVYQCLLLHYTNGTWTRVTCPIDNLRLYAIRMRDATDVWATGRTPPTATSSPVSLHYDGIRWTTVPAPTTISSVELVGSNDGWMVGAFGSILRLINGTWTRVWGADQGARLIDAVSPNEVWYGGVNGQLYQWNGGMAIAHTSPVTTEIWALDMISPTLGWAATWSGQKPYQVLRYTDGAWTTWPMTYPVYDLSMIGSNEGWFATSNEILHYHDGTFEPQPLPGYYGAYSISMIDANHGWAVGVMGTQVISYTDGTWAVVTPTLNAAASKIIGISPSEAWVAGYNVSCDASSCPAMPKLYHFSGGAWTDIITPTNQLPDDWLAFFDISKVSATEWWAAGKLKTLEYAFLHYKDGVYTTVPAAGEDVRAVSMLPNGVGFASGVGSLLWLHSYPYSVFLPVTLR